MFERFDIHGCTLDPCGMKLRFSTKSPLSSKDATKPSGSGFCGLSRHGPAHNGTSARNDLEVGNSPSTGRN